jgi:small GTP-binding protein
MRYDYVLKIILVGDSNTGKSYFFNKLSDKPTDSISSTVGVDFAIIYQTVFDKEFRINLWDTAGQERFHCIVDSYFRNINGFILFFDINEPNSFYSLQRWIDKIEEQNLCSHSHPMVLIGNKNDLPHKVDQNDIIKFTEKYNLMYVELSLKKNSINIKDILEILVCRIYQTLIKNDAQLICSNIKSYEDYHNMRKKHSLINNQEISSNKELKKNWLEQMQKYFCFL